MSSKNLKTSLMCVHVGSFQIQTDQLPNGRRELAVRHERAQR